MDLLSELLNDAGVRRRLLHLRELPEGAALRFPCERSVGLHLVTRGRVFVHAPSLAAPMELHAGDIALMARGCDHALATMPSLAGATLATISAEPAEAPPPQPGANAVISGAFQLWNAPLHPFFAGLPAWFVLRAEARGALGPLALAAGLLGVEIDRRELGADSIVQGLLDVVFAYVLREAVAQQGGAGFGPALRDAAVHAAVAAMHADCARAWTLEDLAARAGLSRTTLAERFREAMGDTPLAYLRTVRLQRAMRILAETDRHLEVVAAEVGYQDAFSFSKAFKKGTGLSPKEFRRRDAAERGAAWRFGG